MHETNLLVLSPGNAQLSIVLERLSFWVNPGPQLVELKSLTSRSLYVACFAWSSLLVWVCVSECGLGGLCLKRHHSVSLYVQLACYILRTLFPGIYPHLWLLQSFYPHPLYSDP